MSNRWHIINHLKFPKILNKIINLSEGLSNLDFFNYKKQFMNGVNRPKPSYRVQKKYRNIKFLIIIFENFNSQNIDNFKQLFEF